VSCYDMLQDINNAYTIVLCIAILNIAMVPASPFPSVEVGKSTYLRVNSDELREWPATWEASHS
jgi:hypothetical protein